MSKTNNTKKIIHKTNSLLTITAMVLASAMITGCGMPQSNSSKYSPYHISGNSAAAKHKSSSSAAAKHKSNSSSASKHKSSSSAAKKVSIGCNIPTDQATTVSSAKISKDLLQGDSRFCSYAQKIVRGNQKSVSNNFHSRKTWYVDPSAGATSNSSRADGSKAHPFSSIEKSISHLKAGDILYLRGGTYSPSDTIELDKLHGTKNHYIQIAGYPGEKAIIDGSGFAGKDRELIQMEGSSYLWLQNISIQNFSGPKDVVAVMLCNSANHIIISDCEISEIKTDDPKKKDHTANAIICYNTESTKKGSANNILLFNNNIHDCKTGWSEAVTMDENTEYANVVCNKVVNTGNIGIDFAGNYYDDCDSTDVAFCRHCLAYGNYVADCIADDGITCYGIYADGAQDITIHSNIVTRCSGGIEVGAEETPDTDAHSTRRVNVINNLVSDNLEKGITVGGYDTDTTGIVFDTLISHNTLINNAQKNTADDGAEITISKVNGLKIQYNKIENSDKNMPVFSYDLGKKYVKNLSKAHNSISHGN